MADELKDLERLSPEARIKKLKELEEKRKKEIEDAQELLKKSEAQLEEEKKIIEQIPIPQLRAVDIDSLFSESEKELFKAKRFTSAAAKKEEKIKQKVADQVDLEETLEQEAHHVKPEQQELQKQYQIELSQEPAAKLAEMAHNLYETVKQQGGDMNDYQRQQAYNIEKAKEMKDAAVKSGSYNPDDYQRRQLDLLDDVSSKLIVSYKRAG